MFKKIQILLLFSLFLTGAFNIIAQNTNNKIYEYTVDTNRSYLFWKIDIHYGTVPLKSGKLITKKNEISYGNFVIKMDSLKDEDIDYDLMRKTLDNTLRSEVFFNVKKYPSSTFEIYYTEKKDNYYKITGNLTILGITKCISFDAKMKFSPNYFEAVSDTFKINRTDWGLSIYSVDESTNDGSVIIGDSISFVVNLYGKSIKKSNQ